MLSSEVIVGVAVDLDARQIFFATDGKWDEVPAFGEEEHGDLLFGVGMAWNSRPPKSQKPRHDYGILTNSLVYNLFIHLFIYYNSLMFFRIFVNAFIILYNSYIIKLYAYIGSWLHGCTMLCMSLVGGA